MKKIILTPFLVAGLCTIAAAQTIQPKDLAGLWRMKMDINADGVLRGEGNDDPLTACLLKITTKPDGEFDGEFTQCGQEKYIAGNLYNNQLMNAVLYGNEGSKYVYTGRVTPQGTLKGNYFTPTCLYGEFEWEKVPAEPVVAATQEYWEEETAALPLPTSKKAAKNVEAPAEYAYVTPPSPTAKKVGERVETYQAAKTVFEDDTHPFDPNIPMASAYNGNDAIFAGKIEGSTKTVYETKTRIIPIYAEPKVETPKEEPKPAPKYEFKKYEMATAAATNMPIAKAEPTPIPEKAIKKMDVCDVAVPGIKPDYVVRGKKVSDKTGDYHIVGHGETMYTIAKYYNVTVANLGEWNDKPCERLRQGEKLRISAAK
jgi:LysM repeat protein